MNLPCQIRVLLLIAFAAIAASFPALAWTASDAPRAPWSGVVTYVVDGDTLHVKPPEGGKSVSIHIDGIDAPEICQPGGAMARDALKRNLLGKSVVVYSKIHDDYGRLVARIFLNGEDLGQWMVAQGLAWSYRYRNYASPYAGQQGLAQKERVGMFSSAVAPAYPGSFRKQHGSCYLQSR